MKTVNDIINNTKVSQTEPALSDGSVSGVRRGLLTVYIMLAIAGVAFYLAQNNGQLSGGGIALPKLLWLSCAILCWFCLPFLIVSDGRISATWRDIYRIFLINMLVRAVVELWMMYISHNWSPYYGIAHDIFSVLLLSALMLKSQAFIQRGLWFGFSVVLLLMFLTEIAFVFYMLLNVTGSASGVYFVPQGQRHSLILDVTWAVVALLAVYLVVFTRRWLRGEFVRAGT